MSEAEITDQCSPSSNGSPTSTQRVARWRDRRRRGVLYVAGLQVFAAIYACCNGLVAWRPMIQQWSAKMTSKQLFGAYWTVWRGG